MQCISLFGPPESTSTRRPFSRHHLFLHQDDFFTPFNDPVNGPHPFPHPNLFHRPKERPGTTAAFQGHGILKEIHDFILLRLPSLYFSRVARIFEEADMPLAEIKEIAPIYANSNKKQRPFDAAAVRYPGPRLEPMQAPAGAHLQNNLKVTREAFINSVMQEWGDVQLHLSSASFVRLVDRTFSVVRAGWMTLVTGQSRRFYRSTLPLPMRIQDPQHLDLSSVYLTSLLSGYMCVIRFGTMRRACKAAEWASVNSIFSETLLPS
jgi:hypothetical protein